MPAARNVLFIMCDQLRFDYLGCTGHPTLETPNIDRLAARGVRFANAYVQSPICGPSRMSFYTGRYVQSHGSTWNGVPLRVGEPTLGDHLRGLGVRTVLVGKTHMTPDVEGMKRLGIAPDTVVGVLAAQCGFEPYERDDGLHPSTGYDANPAYDAFLRDNGFAADNPWEDWANSAEGEEGEILSGWLLAHADKAARIPSEYSETAYMVDRTIQFLDEAGRDPAPWCLHLSLIKPHWPYIAPSPYHALYGAADVVAAVRSEAEKVDPHPIYASFMQERVSRAFSDPRVRDRVIPAYMGLIKQIDDEIGRLMAALQQRNLLEETLIVFTSDHGDYLGDHWLGEKELFHDQSVKIPLIIVDPSPDADATRGSVEQSLVEAIDLSATFIEHFGGAARPHIVEGRSLRPLIAGTPPAEWRQFVVSEYDYAMRLARVQNNVPISRSRLVMAADARWKYIEADGFRPMLFDRLEDPDEFTDLGASPAHAKVCAEFHERLAAWGLRQHNRITISDEQIAQRYGTELGAGILIGYWDEAEVEADRQSRRPGG